MTVRRADDRLAERNKTWWMLQSAGALMVLVAAVLMFLPAKAFGAGSQGTVTAPTAPAGPYTDKSAITVSGTGFSSRNSGNTIQILECSDPNGDPNNLPQDNSTCDGTTINSKTVVPTCPPSPGTCNSPGNFTAQYTLTKLTAGGTTPITCDHTNYCVLWIGEDYVNSFTGTSAQPVAFSPPFLIDDAAAGGGSGGGSTLGTGTTTGGGPVPAGGTSGPVPSGSTGSSSTTPSPTGAADPAASAGTSVPTSSASSATLTTADAAGAPSLAFTGPPRYLALMLGLGGLLILSGGVARRRLTAGRR